MWHDTRNSSLIGFGWLLNHETKCSKHLKKHLFHHKRGAGHDPSSADFMDLSLYLKEYDPSALQRSNESERIMD